MFCGIGERVKESYSMTREDEHVRREKRSYLEAADDRGSQRRVDVGTDKHGVRQNKPGS
jgi:hypothetical protein